MADADFRQKFPTKILNPQMGILTQTQIIFWGKFKFSKSLESTNIDPRWKKIFFWRNQLPYLLPLTYHKFMTTFYFFFSELSQKNYFFPKTLFFPTKIFLEKKCFFWKKQFWSWKIGFLEKNNFFVIAQKKKKKKSHKFIIS